MKKLKRLANSDELNIFSSIPFADEELKERQMEYSTLPIERFKKKYRHHLFTPVKITINRADYSIQLNGCYNPFCKWYGFNQKKYNDIKSKPSRFKLGQRNDTETGISKPTITCNEVVDLSVPGESLNHTNETISNWSVAEEIKRLISINSTVPIEPEYIFHKQGCQNNCVNPFDNKESFYKRGKSSSNSTKYQCKECKKITNVLPGQDESFNYHQSRNEILIDFTKDLLSRTPVRRTCEKLNIASGTYYNKLEWVYRKCLEFLQRHETAPLKEKVFNEMFLNTDMMIYNLNNIRLKGKGGTKNIGNKEKKLQTYLVASGDIKSGYIFRSDIAYDYNVSLQDIEKDTKTYNCDRSYSFLRKNERLKYSYCPQPPISGDSKDFVDYIQELSNFENRKNYVEGSHVKSQYTATVFVA